MSEAEWLASLRPSRIRDVQAGAPEWTKVHVIDVESGIGDALRAGLETFGADTYIAPTGAPFAYASFFAPIFLFYEITELRSVDDALARLAAHDHELAMWSAFR